MALDPIEGPPFPKPRPPLAPPLKSPIWSWQPILTFYSGGILTGSPLVILRGHSWVLSLFLDFVVWTSTS